MWDNSSTSVAVDAVSAELEDINDVGYTHNTSDDAILNNVITVASLVAVSYDPCQEIIQKWKKCIVIPTIQPNDRTGLIAGAVVYIITDKENRNE